MNSIIIKLIRSKKFSNALSYIYNLIYSKIPLYKSNFKSSTRGAFIRLKRFRIKGKNNLIHIGVGTKLHGCKIIISGSNNILHIDRKCRLCNTTLWIDDDNNEIIINEFTTIEGGSIAAMEGTKIHLGRDCMLSLNIDIRSGDSHAIYSQNNRINKSKDIRIGNHVWIGARSTILKGSYIADGSIIGHSSIVNKNLFEPNSIYVGQPARKVKDGIEWTRERK